MAFTFLKIIHNMEVHIIITSSSLDWLLFHLYKLLMTSDWEFVVRRRRSEDRGKADAESKVQERHRAPAN